MNARGVARTTAGAVVAAVTLLGAALAGLRVPGDALVRGISAGSPLEYTALPGSVRPLTAAFVAQALGLPPPEEAGASVAGPVSAVPAVPGGEASSALDADIVVAHAPTNDDFARAYDVPSTPFTARTDASRAGRESSEPATCAPAGPTVWYRYRPSVSVGLLANTIGSGGAASLGVFTGESLADLRQVRCDTDVRGQAQIAFSAAARTTYYFQIALPAGGADVTFSLDQLGTTTRVSAASSPGETPRGVPRDGSWSPAISRDGRFVVFESDEEDLVSGDENGSKDVFVHDRSTGRTELVSVATDGTQGNAPSGDGQHAISDDGRYVAFYSEASNLVDRDSNGWTDVFVRDRLTGTTERVSISSSGAQGRAPDDPTFGSVERDGCDPCPAIERALSMSADGRFVAFESELVGLVDGDDDTEADNGGVDVFVHDRATGDTTMVSVSSSGEYANDWSDYPSISADGRYVAFRSFATNLDDNELPGRIGALAVQAGRSQVFLHDRQSGRTELVSTSTTAPGNDSSWGPALSADGRHVAFASWANNLVDDDDNEFLDVFVVDRGAGTIDRISVSTAGDQQTFQQADTNRLLVDQIVPDISDDGRYVVFESDDPDLDPEDTNGVVDVFLRDRLLGTTRRVSVSSDGTQGDAASLGAVISGDGNHVAFASLAEDFGSPDDRQPDIADGGDIFVHTVGRATAS